MYLSKGGNAPYERKIMTTITAKELATRLDTDARTVRKFLRADAAANEAPTPGKGARYSIEAKQVASLKKRFKAWDAARTPAAPADEVEVIDDIDAD